MGSQILIFMFTQFGCHQQIIDDTSNLSDTGTVADAHVSQEPSDDVYDSENVEQDDTNLPSNFDISNYSSGVYTFAGSGEMIGLDGNGVQASFAEPTFLRTSHDGSVYILDRSSKKLRSMTGDGTVRTISFQGPQPNDPVGIAVHENGDVYISSSDEHCIYKIQDGLSSVFAGTCSTSNQNGSGYQDGAVAQFSYPKEISFDLNGNLIVADSGNSRIRMIESTGLTSTIAGADIYGTISDGPALSSIAYFPTSVTVDANNVIYFAGMDNCIRRLIDGNIETVAGLCQNYSNTGTIDGPALEAKFDNPRGLHFNEQQELMIVDATNDRIRILSEDKTSISTLTGESFGFLDGSLESALFAYPSSIISIDGGYLVTDSMNNRIRLIVP